jgi:hypothetical protein
VKADMVRAYVETLLERLTGQDRVESDNDGDYPVRFRSALYYVRLIGDVDPVLQVFATAVAGVEPTPALYERLNVINTNIRFARAFFVRGQVLVESDLVGQTVDKEEFEEACNAVATITDHYGPRLAEEFGGTTAFADEKSEDVPVPDSASTGQYL